MEIGALDIESVNDVLAAILPDGVTQDMLAAVFDMSSVSVSPAVPRDDGSVWLLASRTIQIGTVLIASPQADAHPEALTLVDANAFGTGHHPTTALCIEAIEKMLALAPLDSILDVGTGSGILALVALKLGVAHALGLDTDAGALAVAAENARLNRITDRFQLVLGGPAAVTGTWPLVVANVLAAPLIDMAPVLVQRLGTGGRLILSGIPSTLESEVRRAYEHFGIRHIESKTRAGWTMWAAQASW